MPMLAPRLTTSRTWSLPSVSRRYTTPSSLAHAQPVALNRRALIQEKLASVDALHPGSPSLVDTFGRHHNYLRISLTERCNLRCFYCMPEEGIELSPKQNILSNDEIIRLAALFVKSGVTKIRLTGGEPTIRKGIVDLVARLSALREYGLKSIGITSNGLILHRHLPSLVENGLTHLNLSLDTLDPFKFEIMTRRMGHEAVLKTLNMALATPILKTKMNVVVIKGLNDSEVLDFVEMTKDQDLSIRFIEFMPFTGNKWDKAKMVPSAELLSTISAQHPGITKAADELNDTARSYRIPGYRGSVGFISSMSDHFCSSCNRLRLTADGQIKVCLFDAKEVSLRDQMRMGVDDATLLQTIGRAVRGKNEKHAATAPMRIIQSRSALGLLRAHRTKELPMHLLTLQRPLQNQIRLRSSKAGEASLPTLTHIDSQGRPVMVDVTSKAPSSRQATASGCIYLPRVAYDLLLPALNSDSGSQSQVATPDDLSALEKAKAKARGKGDVLAVAQLAGIMAAKRTADLIPLCHPLPLTHVSVTLTPHTDAATGAHSVRCTATAACDGKTGVEMEALTAVSVSLLTVWDMLKAVAGREMLIGDMCVTHKAGGKSGDFVREGGN
ncbi:molybdenum cofactor biosynthesis prote [Auriscalpium vulgare]|uniref:Molybdenum cofactor biosynthesis prote n=1 Tax=Auriscalpium vulgare TaxID=40419 RepID=A0ACB8RR88_9AGAM|nr:molybdenum cofactor biosynthesis prote [Auriscalpium vulgare]